MGYQEMTGKLLMEADRYRLASQHGLNMQKAMFYVR